MSCLAIVAVGPEVLLGLDLVCGLGERGRDAVVIAGRDADQRLFGGARARGHVREPAHRDARAGAAPVSRLQRDADPDHRQRVGDESPLLVGASGAPLSGRDGDGCEDLVVLPRRLQGAADEILRRHGARAAVRHRQLQLCAQPDRGGRHAGGDIVPAEAAADGAPVAHLPVSHALGCVAERSTGAGEALIPGDLRVAGHGPDAHSVRADVDAREPVHRLQVDQAARAHEARLDRLHEALAARHEDRVAFVEAAERGERVRDRRRPHILVDRCWIHGGCSPSLTGGAL